MRPTIAFLLLVGMLLGPAYYGYCLLLSGKVSQTFELGDRANRWVTPDGSILRFANGMAYKPLALALTPDMNRIVLRLRFVFDENVDSDRGRQHYQATLSELDHNIIERPFVVSAARGGEETFDIGPMEITYPAQYVFVLEQRGEAQPLRKLTLDVIENAETPYRPVVWAGMGLLLLALVLALRDLTLGVKTVGQG